MLRVCQFCRTTCAAVEAACPACGAPLPPDPVPTPRIDGEPHPQPPGSADAWRRLAAPAGVLAVILTIGGVVWGANALLAGPLKTQDSTGRIKAGMHIHEVGRLLDGGPPPSPSYPRMRDWFPADEFGDGTIDYEGDGQKLKIGFVGGYVTCVDESPSSAGPGLHGYTMVVRQR